ncbi:hypothetical protein D018_4045C, partial [Vibrio parahaemolyticus VP2007-007]
DGLN